MARQVYYDPFGMRTAGYQAGVKDEIAVQDQTRRARNSDWDYRNMNPLRLQEQQRITQYNKFADPYMRRGLGITERSNIAGLAQAELPIYGEEARLSGDSSGYNARMGMYTSGQYMAPNNQFLAHRDYQQAQQLQDPRLQQPGWSAEIAARYGVPQQDYAQAHAQMPIYPSNIGDSTQQRLNEDQAYKQAEFDANQAWRGHQMDNNVANYNRNIYGVDMRAQQRGGYPQQQIFDPAMHGFGLPGQQAGQPQQPYSPTVGYGGSNTPYPSFDEYGRPMVAPASPGVADRYDQPPVYSDYTGAEDGIYYGPTMAYNPQTGQYDQPQMMQGANEAYGADDYAQDF